MPKTVNLVLVRHGETVDNVNGLRRGQSESQLSEIGRKQAEILGNALADEVFTRIFSSDLSRAVHTAAIVKSLSRTSPPNIVMDVRLRARGFGVFEGLPVSALREEAKRLGILPAEMHIDGGETLQEVTGRVVGWLEGLFDLCDGKSEVDENVLAVTHGGCVRSFVPYLLAHPELFKVYNLDHSRPVSGNTGVTRIQIGPISSNGTRSIVFLSLNDISHLGNKGTDEHTASIIGTMTV